MSKFILIFVVFATVTSCAPSPTLKAVKSSKVPITSNFHQQFLSQINAVRSKGRECGKKYFPATTALTLNRDLNHVAKMHSQDMFKHQFLEHISSNGDTLVERMQRVNYEWRAIAENIAHNQKSIGQVIDDWLSSPGHCSNMMSPAYTQTGIANVNRYWTQVYAAPK